MKNSDSFLGEAVNMFFGAKKDKVVDEDKRAKNKKVGIKGENIETGINVSLEDAFFGTSKKISLRAVDRKDEDFYCQNSGWY